jgi:hypothetical protein
MWLAEKYGKRHKSNTSIGLPFDASSEPLIYRKSIIKAAGFDKVPVAGHRAVALDRADDAVGAGVLVDLRSAVLDHLLSLGRRAAYPLDQYRFSRHAVAGAVLADHGQHLARHSVAAPSRPRSLPGNTA